jgi:hypothetical protein
MPEHAAHAITRARKPGLVIAGEARRKQNQRPGEVARGEHLDCHVGAQAMADHSVGAEVGGEPAREPRVVVHAEVVRRLGATVSRQRRSHEADRRLLQPRPCQHVVVVRRRDEAPARRATRDPRRPDRTPAAPSPRGACRCSCHGRPFGERIWINHRESGRLFAEPPGCRGRARGPLEHRDRRSARATSECPP